MNITQAQQDMRQGYLGGSPGVLASGLVWLTAGFVAWFSSPENSMLALFLGGMFIHPAGMTIAKALGRPGTHSSGNPLGTLALESTVLMLLCLPLAYAASWKDVSLFFPAMMIIIGGRYLLFSTIYGLRLYWVLGASLAGGGFLLVFWQAPLVAGAWTGAAVELVFAAFLFWQMRQEPSLKTIP